MLSSHYDKFAGGTKSSTQNECYVPKEINASFYHQAKDKASFTSFTSYNTFASHFVLEFHIERHVMDIYTLVSFAAA